MLYQPNPPFPPTIIEAEAIINVGLMFVDLIMPIIFVILMIHLFNKLNSYKDSLPIIVVYLFSLLVGMESLEHEFTHFSPIYEIFFMFFQTIMFLLSSFKVYSNYSKKGL